jgi:hypothetical protein
MIKKAFIILIILTYSFRFWQSTGCLQQIGHTFLPLSIKIRVEEQVGIDKDIPRNASRFFHNKVSEGFFEISKTYFNVFDSRLLLEILGPLGLVLLVIGLLEVRNKKNNKLYLSHLMILLIIPFILMLKINTKTSFNILFASLYSFSFWGLGFFSKSILKKIIFIILVAITFFYFSFNWQMSQLCNEIFFN